jgi:uncharacterized damage-inducible protein DinB
VTVTDEQGRPEPPVAADEATTLLGFLDFQRATLAWKCAGVGAAGLTASTGPTDMTLGGLLRHMVLVEDHWFGRMLHDRPRWAPWPSVDWDDRDWEWHADTDETPEQLLATWHAAVERSRAAVADALAQGDLGQLARRPWSDGTAPSLRWILCHMIEEYARHNGHADLLREAVDGAVGE